MRDSARSLSSLLRLLWHPYCGSGFTKSKVLSPTEEDNGKDPTKAFATHVGDLDLCHVHIPTISLETDHSTNSRMATAPS